MTFIDLLKSIGIEVPLVIAGSSGAIVLLTKVKNMTRTQRFLVVLSGGLSANYITPLLEKVLGWDDSTHYGLAFLVGYSGMEFVKLLINESLKKVSK